MTNPQRQRIASAETIARHMCSYHAASSDEQLLLASHLADAIIYADLQAAQYATPRAVLRGIAIAPDITGSTHTAGVRAEACALLSRLSRSEQTDEQRQLLAAVATELAGFWPSDSLPAQIAYDCAVRLAGGVA